MINIVLSVGIRTHDLLAMSLLTIRLDQGYRTEWRLFLYSDCFFKNGPTLASFSFIFGLFKQTSLQFLQQIYVLWLFDRSKEAIKM